MNESEQKWINQFEPWFDDEEKNELNHVIDSGWLQESTLTRKFENTFASYVGSKYAIATTSGTIALFIALHANGIGSHDKVIVPDYTAIGTLNAVSLTGATVEIVDIDRQDGNMSVDSLEKSIDDSTRAIIPVHINGRPVQLEKITKIAKDHDIVVVEDAAQCLGSRKNSQHLGTFADVGCFSLATSKIITTGQGGMIVTSSKELFEKMIKCKDQGTLARLKSTSIPDWYESIGFNFKFSDLQSAVGIAQFKKLGYRIKRRLEMQKLYEDLLSDLVEFFPTDISKGVVPWYHDVLFQSTDERTKVLSYLKQNKIRSREFYRPLHTQPVYRRDGDFVNTETISSLGAWLPSSTFLTDDEIIFVTDKIKESLK